MPTIKRLTDHQVSEAELIKELREHEKNNLKTGVAIRGADGKEVEKIAKGDIVYMKPEHYQSTNAADGVPLLVVNVVPETGLILAAFHDKTGNVVIQFFNDTVIERKQGSKAPAKAATPRKRGSSSR